MTAPHFQLRCARRVPAAGSRVGSPIWRRYSPGRHRGRWSLPRLGGLGLGGGLVTVAVPFLRLVAEAAEVRETSAMSAWASPVSTSWVCGSLPWAVVLVRRFMVLPSNLLLCSVDEAEPGYSAGQFRKEKEARRRPDMADRLCDYRCTRMDRLQGTGRTAWPPFIHIIRRRASTVLASAILLPSWEPSQQRHSSFGHCCGLTEEHKALSIKIIWSGERVSSLGPAARKT